MLLVVNYLNKCIRRFQLSCIDFVNTVNCYRDIYYICGDNHLSSLNKR